MDKHKNTSLNRILQIPKLKFHQCVFGRMSESRRHTRKTKHGEKKIEKLKRKMHTRRKCD